MVVLEDTLGTRQRDTRGRSKKKSNVLYHTLYNDVPETA